MSARSRGFSLIELLVVVAIIGMTVSVAAPAWMNMRRRNAVRAASSEIRSIFHLVRSRAVAKSRYAGVKFTRNGAEWQYAIYDDGDGDGVRNDDITSGVDRRVAPARFLWQQPAMVSVSLPSFVKNDPDGSALKPGAPAVQFGLSTICSFSPVGESTSGSIYLCDRGGSAWAVRVFGPTARVRLLRYDAARNRWVER